MLDTKKFRVDLGTSRVLGEWCLEDGHRYLGDTEFRLHSAHELFRMLRPERWSRVELGGGLDGRPFDLDSPRLVPAATR